MTKDQLKQLEADLWSAADNLRANSDLKSSEYSTPVQGLIFLFHSAYMISEKRNLCTLHSLRKTRELFLPAH